MTWPLPPPCTISLDTATFSFAHHLCPHLISGVWILSMAWSMLQQEPSILEISVADDTRNPVRNHTWRCLLTADSPSGAYGGKYCHSVPGRTKPPMRISPQKPRNVIEHERGSCLCSRSEASSVNAAEQPSYNTIRYKCDGYGLSRSPKRPLRDLAAVTSIRPHIP